MTCCCQTIGAPDEVRLCDEHHIYWRSDKRLWSVSQVLNVWPSKPSWDGVDMAVVDNARDRGVDVDTLMCQWLAGELTEIPVGTREDAKDLFLKLVPWWQKYFGGVSVLTQAILDDGEIAGKVDLLIMSTPSAIYDLKCVSELQATYPLQVGGYCHLFEATFGRLPETCGCIHLKKDRREPKLVKYEPLVVASEFRVVRDLWRLWKRKTA